MTSLAQGALEICSLFEGELLVELMFRQWDHPQADDRDYRSTLLETTTEVLQAAVGGTSLIKGLPARDTNFVAALYYAETRALENPDTDLDHESMARRKNWLDCVRHSLPSCFCDPGLLD